VVVALALVVEGPVGLHVPNARARRNRHRHEPLDLLRDALRERVVVHDERHPPEVLAIGISRVGADGDAPFDSEGDRARHGLVVAGVRSAGDVRAGDRLHHRGVRGQALAEIAVEVDRAHLR
jgi:hypothetical protein